MISRMGQAPSLPGRRARSVVGSRYWTPNVAPVVLFDPWITRRPFPNRAGLGEDGAADPILSRTGTDFDAYVAAQSAAITPKPAPAPAVVPTSGRILPMPGPTPTMIVYAPPPPPSQSGLVAFAPDAGGYQWAMTPVPPIPGVSSPNSPASPPGVLPDAGYATAPNFSDPAGVGSPFNATATTVIQNAPAGAALPTSGPSPLMVGLLAFAGVYFLGQS